MHIKQENIYAFRSMIHKWKTYVDRNHAGNKYDPCLEVGYMFMDFRCTKDPRTHSPHGCGFVVTVKHDIVTSESTRLETDFKQTKDGIRWTIKKHQDGKDRTLHSGTIRDTSLLSGNPDPSTLHDNMLKVAKVTVDIARTEKTLMHI